MSSFKIAVVTGANQGIGFAIVRGLCKRFDGLVYLTARNEERGKKAVSELEKEGLYPKFHQLDITTPKSVEKFRDYIKSNYGGIDVLVNNAAIAFKFNAPEPVAVQAKDTIFVNYTSLVSTCDILFPILRNGARVVHLSSSSGHLMMIPSEKLRNKLKDPSLTVEQLNVLMQSFVDAAQKGTHAKEWGNITYAVSKVGVSALTRIHQRMLNDRDIKVNCVHPGYVSTSMSSYKGPLTIDEGAQSSLYMALDAPDNIRGQYVWKDCKVIPWDRDMPSHY